MQGAMCLGMLGWRHVTPRWSNDPVWRHNGRNRREGQGGCGYPPPGGEGRSGLRRVSYVTINGGSQVWRGHCPSMEHHHLIIWTHPTDRWPGKQQQHIYDQYKQMHCDAGPPHWKCISINLQIWGPALRCISTTLGFEGPQWGPVKIIYLSVCLSVSISLCLYVRSSASLFGNHSCDL